MPLLRSKKGQRLSHSHLWQVQESFYRNQGVDAWRQEKIPSLVSTNAHVARTYAEAVVANLLDREQDLDLNQPVYVVELGAGAGRLGFLIVKVLKDMKRHFPLLERLQLRYVLADIAPRTIDFWRSHPPLQPLLQDGSLDLACWSDHDGPRLELQMSGQVLEPDNLANPLMVIANYVLDSLAPDAFRVTAGELQESLVQLTQKGRPIDDDFKGDPEDLEIKFSDCDVKLPYYDDPELDALLEHYCQKLKSGTVLLPVKAIRCLSTLCTLASNRLFVLAADKGESHVGSFEGRDDVHITFHDGCFSLMANLHALGLFVEQRGGVAMHAGDPRNLFRLSAFVLGADDSSLHHTRHSLRRALDGFDLRDLLALAVPTDDEKPELDRAIATIKLSEYDPYVLARFSQTIDDAVGEAGSVDGDDRLALLQMLERVGDNDYQLGDHLDLPFLLGRMIYQLDEPDRAIQWYEGSLRQSGDHEATFFNIGLCHEAAGRLQEAKTMFERALTARPDYELAKQRLAAMG